MTIRTLLRLLSCLAALLAGCQSPTEKVLLCGLSEVSVVRTSDLRVGRVDKLWSWKAAGREDLPEDLRKAFGTTDECKPVDGGRRILISASSGGCALVAYPSGKVLWHARVPNAHSLELLPGDRVAVASSVSATGNKLLLFDLARPGPPLWEDHLKSAHGVVWDGKRNRLWAMGFDELRCYEPMDWKTAAPSLRLVASHHLPDTDGHDLQPVPDSPDLILSTDSHVFLFDRDTAIFRPHPTLGKMDHVKAVSPHPSDGSLLWIPANKPNWWSNTMRLENPPSELSLQGDKIYKARWFDEPVPPRPFVPPFHRRHRPHP